MYTYKQITGEVIRNSDGKVIAPCGSPSDTDFLAYQAWCAAGNEPMIDNTASAEAVTILTKYQFNNRFTFAEQVAIEQAAEANAAIRVLQRQLALVEFVDLTLTETQQSVAYLVQAGLISAERSAEILQI